MDSLRSHIDLDQVKNISGIVSLGGFYILFGAATAYFTLQDQPGWIHRISNNRHHRRWGAVFLAAYTVFAFLIWPLIGLYNGVWVGLCCLWAFVLARKKSAPGRILRAVKTLLWHTAFAPRYCRGQISAAENGRRSCGRGPSVLPTWVNSFDSGAHTPPRQLTGGQRWEPRQARTWHERETITSATSDITAQTQALEDPVVERRISAGLVRFINPWEAQDTRDVWREAKNARSSMDVGPTDTPASPRLSGWQPAPVPMRPVYEDDEIFVVGTGDEEDQTDNGNSLELQDVRSKGTCCTASE